MVIHTRQPQWGDGVVDQATTITHEGQPAQRLVVRFANHGRVTINTAMAPLAPKGTDAVMSRTQTPVYSSTTTGQGWLGSLSDGEKHGDELTQLPEALTDPFVAMSKRLEATLDSYRFTNDPHGLLEWAVAQTGLADPMSRYTRHELEQGYERFTYNRDQHLRKLVKQLKSKGQADVIHEIRRFLKIPSAVSALDKASH